jgi:hypothetical protein
MESSVIYSSCKIDKKKYMTKEEIKKVAFYAYPPKTESFCGCSYCKV